MKGWHVLTRETHPIGFWVPVKGAENRIEALERLVEERNNGTVEPMTAEQWDRHQDRLRTTARPLDRMQFLFGHEFEGERRNIMVEMFAILAFGKHHDVVTDGARTEEEIYELWTSMPAESRRAWKASTAKVVASYDKLKAGCW